MRILPPRVRTELRDLIELVALPGLARLLPWPLCFRVFRWLSHWSWLYRAPCEAALAHASQRGAIAAGAQAQWLAHRRLVTLVDHADYHLARSRGDAWMARHLRVDGQWPAPDQAALLCTFHWGAGMWGLRHAHLAGLRPHALVAPLQGAHFAGRSVLHRYAVARTAEVTCALGRPTLDVSASLRPALRALGAQEQVLAVVDVPADQAESSQVVQVFGLRARVPRALLRMAAERAIPVTIYLTGIDMVTGERFLRIRQLEPQTDVDKLFELVFAEFDRALREDTAAWHFWSESERFFEREG